MEDDLTGHKFDNKEYMTYFTLVYNMCGRPRPPSRPRLRGRAGPPQARALALNRAAPAPVRCTQKPPHNYSEQLYQRYKKAISDYLNSAVLPAVREKTGQYMLKEVGKRWS